MAEINEGEEIQMYRALLAWQDRQRERREREPSMADRISRTQYALDAVLVERERQETLKAEGRFRYTCADVEMSDGERMCVLVEEVGEAARAVLEQRRLANDSHGKDLRAELVQVAAVAVAWIEAIDKGSVPAG